MPGKGTTNKNRTKGNKKKKLNYRPVKQQISDTCHTSNSSDWHSSSHPAGAGSRSDDIVVEADRMRSVKLNEERTLDRLPCDDRRRSLPTSAASEVESKGYFIRCSARESCREKKCPSSTSSSSMGNSSSQVSAHNFTRTLRQHVDEKKTNCNYELRDDHGNYRATCSETEMGKRHRHSGFRRKTTRGSQKYTSSWRGASHESVGVVHDDKPAAAKGSGGRKNRGLQRAAAPDKTQQKVSAVNQSQSSNCTSPQQGMRNIPGFYYDHKKKRYFRIVPGHSNTGSCITTETINNNKAEDKRQALMKRESQPKIQNSKSNSAVSILRSFQQGSLTGRQYSRYSIECRIRAMDVLPSTILEPMCNAYGSSGLAKVEFVQLDRDQSKLMVVLNSMSSSSILMGTVETTVEDSKKQLKVSDWQVVFRGDRVINSASLVTGLQHNFSNPQDTYVLYPLRV